MFTLWGQFVSISFRKIDGNIQFPFCRFGSTIKPILKFISAFHMQAFATANTRACTNGGFATAEQDSFADAIATVYVDVLVQVMVDVTEGQQKLYFSGVKIL